ncbi:C-type lectin domain family 4 member A isoform X2 [Pezoporus occidentalis]|uniref:C-type lectin domain family 4 member A isoform X2 n=1 Tax=Pezoporus occidentalis TaxID=407982 RepID=UPI002F91A8F2
MPVVGWNQFHPVHHLSVMSFQWSFCSLTWKIVSFWLGRQPYHLFGPVFSELWTRDPPTPLFQLHSIPGGPDVSCSGLGQTVDKQLWPPVAPFSHSSDKTPAFKQKFKEWSCDSAAPGGKEKSWACCPKGWKRFEGSCYYLSGDMMSWADSEQNCTGMGSHLVVINSEAEQDFLSKEVKKPSRRENHYIGLSAQMGQWHWVDQTPFNVTAAFWREGEPSNPDYEKCVVIHRTSRALNNWNDVQCNDHNRICEAAAIIV